jgi:hypothetical protein
LPFFVTAYFDKIFLALTLVIESVLIPIQNAQSIYDYVAAAYGTIKTDAVEGCLSVDESNIELDSNSQILEIAI